MLLYNSLNLAGLKRLGLEKPGLKPGPARAGWPGRILGSVRSVPTVTGQAWQLT